MTLTARDRKLLVFLLPVFVLGAYWVLVLAPKRSEVGELGDAVVQEQQKRDQAVGEAQRVEAAKAHYADDLGTIIRVGKAVPSSVDMPSLIVQLDRAARGTGIRFKRIKTGERTAAAPAAPSSGSGSTPAAAPGGAAATTGPGKATEQAGEAKQRSDAQSTAAGGAPASSSSTPGAAGAAAAPGLDSVPLEFTFSGNFFELADLFHRLKRFVRVANEQVLVHGRLMTINGLTLNASEFPVVTAEVTATVYLSPKSQGATAGATPQGPGSAPPASPQQAASPTSPPPQPPNAIAAR